MTSQVLKLHVSQSPVRGGALILAFCALLTAGFVATAQARPAAEAELAAARAVPTQVACGPANPAGC